MTGASTYTYEVDLATKLGGVTRARGGQKRVQEFLSVDPLTASYPMLTPYQFASNTPIMAIDLDGLESVTMVDYYSLNSEGAEIKLGSSATVFRDANDGPQPQGNVTYEDKGLGEGLLYIRENVKTGERHTYFVQAPTVTPEKTIIQATEDIVIEAGGRVASVVRPAIDYVDAKEEVGASIKFTAQQAPISVFVEYGARSTNQNTAGSFSRFGTATQVGYDGFSNPEGLDPADAKTEYSVSFNFFLRDKAQETTEGVESYYSNSTATVAKGYIPNTARRAGLQLSTGSDGNDSASLFFGTKKLSFGSDTKAKVTVGVREINEEESVGRNLGVYD